MKIEIKSENENPFLKRRELEIVIEHSSEPTPSMVAFQQFLAKELNKDVQKIEIKYIFSEFGEQKSRANVFVWEEKNVPDLSVTGKKIKKEKKKKQEKPVEQKKE